MRRATPRARDPRRVGLPDHRRLATATGACRARPARGRRLSDARTPARAGGPMRTRLAPLALCAAAIGGVAGCGVGSSTTATKVEHSRPVGTDHDARSHSPGGESTTGRAYAGLSSSSPRRGRLHHERLCSRGHRARGDSGVDRPTRQRDPVGIQSASGPAEAPFRNGRRRLDRLAFRTRDRGDRTERSWPPSTAASSWTLAPVAFSLPAGSARH